jgi:two-component system chemotaxis response regulator CheY
MGSGVYLKKRPGWPDRSSDKTVTFANSGLKLGPDVPIAHPKPSYCPSMNILLAEDDKISRDLLRRIVESEGQHTVTAAHDGEEAWAILSDPAKSFDVCIFDIYMPKLSGLELVERMRAGDTHKSTAIILCTAVHDRATVQRAAALGVSHYVIKPYSRTLMLDKLGQIGRGLVDDDVLESPEVVCRRLGIEADMHRVMLAALVEDVEEWSGLLRGTADPAEVQQLFLRGRGIRGSCLSLGARRAPQYLNAIETVLQAFLAAPSEGEFPQAKMTVLLDDLDREIHLVGDRVKAPA